MHVDISVEEKGDQALLHIRGDIDFARAREVLRVSSAIPDLHARRLVIVLDDTRTMESSALGLFQLLAEKGAGRHRMILRHCAPEVRQLFEVADFGRDYDISESDVLPVLGRSGPPESRACGKRADPC